MRASNHLAPYVLAVLALSALISCSQKSALSGSLSSTSNGSNSAPGTTLVACTFNNVVVASGGTVQGFTTSSVAAGQSCVAETVTCTNGVLNPSNAFGSCTVSTSPAPTPTPSPCSFNGVAVASGSSVTAYLASSVPFGQSCSSQIRSCSNGSLSGSYSFSSCIIAAAPTPTPTPTGPPVSGGSTYTGLHVVNGTGGKAGHIVNGAGQIVLFHGADHSYTETACVGGGPLGTTFSDGHLLPSDLAAMQTWGINIVRVPLNEGCWNSTTIFNGNSGTTGTYQQLLKSYVQLITSPPYNMAVILDLHWIHGYSGQTNMADGTAATFWSQVASQYGSAGVSDTSFKSQVIFDLFNEPYSVSWSCWLKGGCALSPISGTVTGMAQMLSAVRATGAQNVVMMGGLQYAADLTQWVQNVNSIPTLPGFTNLTTANIAASLHAYDSSYSGAVFSTLTPGGVATDSGISAVMAAGYPFIVGETGIPSSGTNGTWWTALLSYFDSQQQGYVSWAWNPSAYDCANNCLLTNFPTSGTQAPSAYWSPMGMDYYNHIHTLPSTSP